VEAQAFKCRASSQLWKLVSWDRMGEEHLHMSLVCCNRLCVQEHVQTAALDSQEAGEAPQESKNLQNKSADPGNAFLFFVDYCQQKKNVLSHPKTFTDHFGQKNLRCERQPCGLFEMPQWFASSKRIQRPCRKLNISTVPDSHPKRIEENPPGGFSTRVVGLSDSTLPQFWLAPFA